ncbi:hypothetical protein KL86DPRO_40080 [uncultured delta proteobacterium]|uniref:Uncharacterized protein n=1 Tax=uncultured delta proteobacterium TaxID=34034 RepID=A0A212KA09_9DELT|nr:hypothetical protein KL86DPRO_40080 [uncultured delta proteobacterium]
MRQFNILAQELTTLMIRICEDRIASAPGSPVERKALAASVLAVQEALKTFVAVELAVKNN